MGVAAAFGVNLVMMGAGAWLAYEEAPSILDRVVGPEGKTVATDGQVSAGKRAFYWAGLMTPGSILGTGA
jgi:nitric oxide reductase subunit B